jgi:hypothetical protein
MFDGGLFLVLLGVGVLFLVPRFGVQFKLMAVFIFFALGTVLVAGEDVGFTTTNIVTGGATTTEFFYLVGDGDSTTFNDNGTWVGWIMIGIGALASFGFLSGYIGGKY